MLPAADFVMDLACDNWDGSPPWLESLFRHKALIELRFVPST